MISFKNLWRKKRKVLLIMFDDGYSFYNDSALYRICHLLEIMGFRVEILKLEQKFDHFDNNFQVSVVSPQLTFKIKEISPNYIIALNAGYLWGCNVFDGKTYTNPLPDLDIPVIAAWDNNLTQLVSFMGISEENIRSVLTSPNIFHFSHDKGDVENVREVFDVKHLSVSDKSLYHIGMLFNENEHDSILPYKYDVSHCGNINFQNLKFNHLSFSQYPTTTQRLVEEVTDRKFDNLATPFFELYCETVKKIIPSLNRRESLFWNLYISCLNYANTKIRLRILTQLNSPVNFFGSYTDEQSRDFLKNVPNIIYHGYVPWGEELKNIYSESKINIIISNTINQNGISPKLMECLLAGGFPLIDKRYILINILGNLSDHITYETINELNDKISYYLNNEQERSEILKKLREKIIGDYVPEDKVLRFMFNKVDDNFRKNDEHGFKMKDLLNSFFYLNTIKNEIRTHVLQINYSPKKTKNFRKIDLSDFRTDPDWASAGAKVSVNNGIASVTTSMNPWSYSAILKINTSKIDLQKNNYYLKIEYSNVSGQPMISIIDQLNNRILYEKMLTKNNLPKIIFLPLQNDGSDALLIRNGDINEVSSFTIRKIHIVRSR